MSRWVDADEFIKIFMKSGCYGAEVINKATQSLLDTPSIDIVRCGKCAYRNNRKKCPMRVFTGDNGFCSYGEKGGE